VALPPIAFVAFSPAASAYVTMPTKAQPVSIAPANVPLPERVARLVEADARAVADASPRAIWPWLAVAAATVLFAVAPFVVRARRRQNRLAAAHAALRHAFANGPTATRTAFEALLAALAGDAMFTAAVWSCLQVRFGEPAVAKLQALHAAVDHARFGAALPSPEAFAAALVPTGRS
jgi:hypothetical protein